ncbi:sialate O-acetylesterase [Neotamlana nanhaiensis]|uniref:sialate O-acetylesterase n=1 Tax=Neotamlana nanhaiensis TaxID=1382798 RepID=UPI001EE22844|nr:sialate O-acetylesterase [Tamlana nanhaiensis]
MDGWYSDLNSKDEGSLASPQWQTKNIDDTSWNTMDLPGYWKNEPIGNINGCVWFRKTIEIPEHMAGKPAKLMLGRIVDQDFVYVNGEFVGTTGYQYPPRRYHIKDNILQAGKNNITVRVINNIGNGGFVLEKPYYLATETDTIQLNGRWKYKVGTKMSSLEGQTFIRWKPVGLYNAMIAPLLNLKIKGVIWYQGESNTKNPKSYFKTFPALIENWRSKWQQGNFPFLYVQLTNFMETKSEPVESSWAELRQAQLETLKVPKTAMAVAIDLGEWNDIHPLNKKDVGKRLALLARKMTYGETDLKASSPMPKQTKFKKDKIVITFKNAEDGLQSINGMPLKTFSVSNDSKHFVWAKAEIKGNKVIVWHNSISQPKIVRYAWSDNPDEANLFSKNNLPASPFQIKKEN